MAYSSSSSSSFQNQKEWDNDITITQEELFAFHNIDRQLFSRLVFNMRCAPMKAIYVVAFWMWLERLHKAQYVANIITHSNIIFKAIFEETLLCLKVMECDTLANFTKLPMLKFIVGKDSDRVIDIKFIHNNRVSILLDIGHIVKETCHRAFQDLIQLSLSSRSSSNPIDHHRRHNLPKPSAVGGSGTPNLGVIGGGRVGCFRPTPPLTLSSNYGGRSSDGLGDLVNNYKSLNNNKVGEMNLPYLTGDQSNVMNQISFQGVGARASNYGSLFSVKYGLEGQSQVQQRDENSQIFEDKPNLLPSERTIFLTFSKGYPILENELREFINRSFGDIIETIHMQPIGENGQALYARLVVRDARAMKIVLSEQGKSKFSINGKHMWARKYVRKNPHSPPTSPTYKF